MLSVISVLRLKPFQPKFVIRILPTILDILGGTLSEWSLTIVFQDRSLYHIPLPQIKCCAIIFRATASSCENQHWRRGKTGMGVATNVTSIVG